MEIRHLKKTLRHNGYSNHEIMCALAPTQKEKPPGIAMILIQQVSPTV
jgi:hypothetical protein